MQNDMVVGGWPMGEKIKRFSGKNKEGKRKKEKCIQITDEKALKLHLFGL